MLLYQFLIIYNIVAFCLMGYDKYQAIKHKWRICEKILLTMMVGFGSIGILCGILFFHHKINKWYFKYGSILMLILHSFILFLQ